ncbi:MAG TPA: transporter substrate-binding domain-containing protein [Jiangellaceae bacterium]|nr:transporter substrate-binding domain-containing protein [Jiangellaceae bacterium]
MRYRRTIQLIAGLAALMIMSTGCGDDDAETAPESPTGTTAEITTLEQGTLTVGSDIPFPPFEFREGGEETGFDVEVVEEIASRLGLAEVTWVDTAFDTIFVNLAGAQFDAAASATTITPEREEMVNFTIPYYRAQQALAINTDATPEIQSTDDLSEGDTVAVQRGTTGELWARENLEGQGVEVRSFPEALDTYTALEAANVTGVIFDEPSVAEEVGRRPGLELVEPIDTGEEYGFAVNPDNEALLEAMNTELQAMIDDGTYQQIYDEWFPEAPAGSVATE